MDSLKERLDASQRAWAAMRRELGEEKSQRAADLDRDRLSLAAEQQVRDLAYSLGGASVFHQSRVPQFNLMLGLLFLVRW